MREDEKQGFSKYLSYLLRHHPESIGLFMMDNGWVNTQELLDALNESKKCDSFITLDDLINVVETDTKERYSFYEIDDNPYYAIRANQGHSIKGLKMEYALAKEPPRYLYHGTSPKAYENILSSGGLKPMNRQMVHLSRDKEIAYQVGKRHSKEAEPVILRIDVLKVFADGKCIYVSDNGVYLMDKVDLDYIQKEE